MRLTQSELKVIKSTIIKIFGESRIFIFGSSLDKKRKGGDIDIFIIPENSQNLRRKRSKVISILEDNLLKPVDLVVHKNFDRTIEKEGLLGVEI
jgi:predicted nucleotidyltransferase